MAPPRRPSPLVPAPVAALTRGVFAAIAASRRPRQEDHRGARVFHPDGIGFAARVQFSGSPAGRDSLLGRRHTHAAIVRLSRAIGLPRDLPEPLGVAVRLLDARGPGIHQDLLFATSAQSPLARHALLPGFGGFFGQFFSSLWPYGVGGRPRMLGLAPVGGLHSPRDLERHAARAGGRGYRRCVARIGGPWISVAQVELGERLPDDVVERIRFNPWNTGEDLRPAGPLMGLRDSAYEGSQRGRLSFSGDGSRRRTIAEPVAPVTRENGARRDGGVRSRLSRA